MESESQPRPRPVSPRARLFAAAGLLAVSVGAGAFVGQALGAPAAGATLGVAIGVAVAACLAVVSRRLFAPVSSQDPSAHQRALDQLSEELTSLASPGDVAGALERTIRRLLPCDSIEFS